MTEICQLSNVTSRAHATQGHKVQDPVPQSSPEAGKYTAGMLSGPYLPHASRTSCDPGKAMLKSHFGQW